MSRILLVEDDEVARRLVASELADAGLTVMSVESGEAALAALQAEPGAFQAIVCDVALPGASGPQALASAAPDALGEAVIVFLSGFGEPDFAALASSRPVRSLQKPLPRGAVVEALAALGCA